tara:strand:- start:7940 stop:8917 length:978 start_codon:yes stop_codon:yes gene_type:complete
MKNGPVALLIRHPRTGQALACVSKESVAPMAKGIRMVQLDTTRGLVTTSTTHVHLLHAGAGLARWKGGNSIKYLRSEEILSWVGEQEVQDVGGENGLDPERIAALNPGAILSSPAYDLDTRGWPLIPIPEYLEPHPLGRTEWMVPLAWMAGDSASGQTSFEQVAHAYEDLMASAFPNWPRKRILTGSVADGVWHAPGHDSFVAQWIRDAGGEYGLQATNAHENVALSLEEVLMHASAVDAWVVVTFDPDTFGVDDLLAQDPRHAALIDAAGEVWACNTAKCDYFGEVVVHPEWVLADVQALVQGAEESPHGLFSRLPLAQSTSKP